MAFSTLLHLTEASGRCFLSTARCHRPHLQISNSTKHTRGFKRIRDTIKETETQITNPSVQSSARPLRNLWKPFGFTVLFGSVVHVGASIWEYERIRNEAYKRFHRYQQWRVNRTGWRKEMEKWWQQLNDGHKVFAAILFVNVIVFLAWQVPRLQPTMIRYFGNSPNSRANCWPLLLATFSHASFVHMAINMYVLYSFSSLAVTTLGREQFAAFYLTSGVVSSFISYLYNTQMRNVGMSLGASGAIMSVVSLICLQFPEAQIGIVFIPMLALSAGTALKALIAVDLAGCIFSWRFIDHAAHLGGACWGIFWQLWGNQIIWEKRGPILKCWHDIRNPQEK